LLHDKAQYYEGVRSVNENVRRMNLAFRGRSNGFIYLTGFFCQDLRWSATRFRRLRSGSRHHHYGLPAME
jgi:hypothetical protein